MRRIGQLIFVLCTVIYLAGCAGGEDSEKSDSAANTETATTSSKVPQPSPFGTLARSVQDTLLALKREYGITRDQYWRKKGGVLANEYLEVWYPVGRVTVTHGMNIFQLLMPVHAQLAEYFGQEMNHAVVVKLPSDMDDYRKKTGRDWWAYSDIDGDTISYQPLYTLTKRGLAGVAVPHEYCQWSIGRMTSYQAPRWLEEGLASHLSDEKRILELQMKEFPERNDPVNVKTILLSLETESDKKQSRIAYYHSYRMVVRIIEEYGEDKLKALVLAMVEFSTFEEACQSVLGVDAEELTRVAQDYKVNFKA